MAGGLKFVILMEELGNFIAAVNLIRIFVHLQNLFTNSLASYCAWAELCLERFVVPAGADVEDSAHHSDGKLVAMFLDPCVFHCDSFAK